MAAKLTKKQRITATAVPCSVVGAAGMVTGAFLFKKYLKKADYNGWEYDPASGILCNEETGEARML